MVMSPTAVVMPAPAMVVTAAAVVMTVAPVVVTSIITGPVTVSVPGGIVVWIIVPRIHRIVTGRGIYWSGRRRRIFLGGLGAFAVTVGSPGPGSVVAAGIVRTTTGKARRCQSGGGELQAAETIAQIFHGVGIPGWGWR